VVWHLGSPTKQFADKNAAANQEAPYKYVVFVRVDFLKDFELSDELVCSFLQGN